MANANKAKGTRYETAVVDFIRSAAWADGGTSLRARRNPLAGAIDLGDLEISGPQGLIATGQCKAAKKFEIAQWVSDCEAQSAAAGTDFGCVFAKAPGKPIGHSYVIKRLSTELRLWEMFL